MLTTLTSARFVAAAFLAAGALIAIGAVWIIVAPGSWGVFAATSACGLFLALVANALIGLRIWTRILGHERELRLMRLSMSKLLRNERLLKKRIARALGDLPDGETVESARPPGHTTA